MDKETVLAEIQKTFRSLFKDPQLVITKGTTQGDIEIWDSLNHAVLIDQIEQKFDVKFNLMDMLDIQNVGDLCDKVLAKLD